MASAVRRKKSKDEIKISIAPFSAVADFKHCEDIQREVWRAQDIDVVPGPLLWSASRNGGILLGAFNTIGELIGFVFSMLGSRDGVLIQYSHMLAVRGAYRNFDVGFKLKASQRKEALKRKIFLIESAIDPLQPISAYFTLGKLGSTANSYEENFGGEAGCRAERGLPADRIIASWKLDDSDVITRIETGPPRHDLRKEMKKKPIINELTEAAPGMMNCTAAKLNCSADQFLFEVPYNLPEIKSRDLGIALEWQGKMRQVFSAYFKKNYSATDFWTIEQEGRLRSFYVLTKNI
jgi:predicted GNAT superfamily acetyltransferase